MPVDFTMRICLGGSPPFHRLLDTYEDLHGGRPRKALRPCLHPSSLSDGWGHTRQKKRVVFADMKGLSLTAVHIFSKMEEEFCELQLALAHLFPSKKLVPCPKPYSLDFPQPASDYLAFRNRLQRDQVCLEQCLIHKRSLSGTVRVCNVGFEKLVQLRVTFNSWRSFHDVACHYIHNTYGLADTDSFSFKVKLPHAPGLQDSIEFCVSFQSGHAIYWDNNHGKNYHIQHRGDLPTNGRKNVSHFDSPGEAPGMFAHWPGWASAEDLGPYW
ncbi:protein phosphatase 1 regulatory subunit 3C-B-like [Ambystoma mexicanum]|uniref:protein phosphatase 1 regulatory subunit 3C-B-like n=1 Tax=Ambystoma mexicanum TaxID=8296 RepID=UPI0037E77FCF